MSVYEEVLAALAGASEPMGCGALAEVCKGATSSTQVAEVLHRLHGQGKVKREGERGTYRYTLAAGGGEAPARGRRKKKTTDDEGPHEPKAAKPNGRDPIPNFGLGISDQGHLGISKGDVKLDLTPQEFERLRGFIEKTDSIWTAA